MVNVPYALFNPTKDLEGLYKCSAWVLERKYGGNSSAYNAFKLAITLVVLVLA